jgi:hypothetical protein
VPELVRAHAERVAELEQIAVFLARLRTIRERDVRDELEHPTLVHRRVAREVGDGLAQVEALRVELIDQDLDFGRQRRLAEQVSHQRTHVVALAVIAFAVRENGTHEQLNKHPNAVRYRCHAPQPSE